MSEHIIDMSNSSYQSTSGLLCADVSQLKEEIVRCRDCRFKAHDDIGFFCRKNIFMGKFEPSGFCKWGERRECESIEVWERWSPDDVTCSEEPRESASAADNVAKVANIATTKTNEISEVQQFGSEDGMRD